MSIPVGIQLTMDSSDLNDFYKKFLRECVKELKKIFQKTCTDITGELGKFISEQIKEQPEYKSIIRGKLHGQLGLTNPKQKMDAIIDQLVKSAVVKVNNIKVVGDNIEGGITI